ncbi:MAG: DUF2934 domain-containing protein [Nitrosomonadales bacterium]|nr:DUF2934 domain-containing protein [Nitrosomonadales bacterium]
MSQEQPLYGELVIPFNAENHSHSHDEANTKAKEMRSQIEQIAYYLAKERGFVPGHELEDWLKAEMQVLRTLK